MVDVDHFKKVNDTHGHVTGDKVLKGVAEILKKKVRGGSAYRYGGEEMAVLLPKAELEGAVAGGRAAARGDRGAQDRAGVKVTASFGVAQFEAGDADPPASSRRPTRPSTRRRRAGRNRVVAGSGARRVRCTQPTRRFTRSA